MSVDRKNVVGKLLRKQIVESDKATDSARGVLCLNEQGFFNEQVFFNEQEFFVNRTKARADHGRTGGELRHLPLPLLFSSVEASFLWYQRV
jgi:hypothetical protein